MFTPEVELLEAVFAARTTCRLFPYARKFAAENHDVAQLSLGLLKRSTNIVSWVMSVLLFTGPHWNCPANAPAVVDTAGTTVVRSISDTFTPGES